MVLSYIYMSIWKDTKLNRFIHILFIGPLLYRFLSLFFYSVKGIVLHILLFCRSQKNIFLNKILKHLL